MHFAIDDINLSIIKLISTCFVSWSYQSTWNRLSYRETHILFQSSYLSLVKQIMANTKKYMHLRCHNYIKIDNFVMDIHSEVLSILLRTQEKMKKPLKKHWKEMGTEKDELKLQKTNMEKCSSPTHFPQCRKALTKPRRKCSTHQDCLRLHHLNVILWQHH